MGSLIFIHVTGRIGAGTARLHVHTSNGSISVGATS